MDNKRKIITFLVVVLITGGICITGELIKKGKTENTTANNQELTDKIQSVEEYTDSEHEQETNKKEKMKTVKILSSDYKTLDGEILSIVDWMSPSEEFEDLDYESRILQLGLYGYSFYSKVEVDPLKRIDRPDIYNDCVYVISVGDFLKIAQYKFNLSETLFENLDDFDSDDYDAEGWFAYVYEDKFFFCPPSIGGNAIGYEPEIRVISEEENEAYVECNFYDYGSKNLAFSYYVIGGVKEDSQDQRFWSFTYWGDSIPYEEEASPEWENAYKDILYNFSGQGDEPRFLLVYIDGDNIPELIISEGNDHVSGVHVYTYYNNSVEEVGYYGEYGSICYDEGENKFYRQFNGMGTELLSVIEIKNGKENELVSIVGCVDEYDDAPNSYYIDSNQVSEQEYNDARQSYYEQKKHTVVTYDDCIPITSQNIEKL